MSTKCKEGHRGISIHASREGSDYPARLPAVFQCRFQSTLPAREATAILRDRLEKQKISIHASREGSDESSARRMPGFTKFQSTLPAREATFLLPALRLKAGIFQSTLPAREATHSTVPGVL